MQFCYNDVITKTLGAITLFIIIVIFIFIPKV